MFKSLVKVVGLTAVSVMFGEIAYCAIPLAQTFASNYLPSEPGNIIPGTMGVTLVLLGGGLMCYHIYRAAKALHEMLMYKSRVKTALYVLSLEQKDYA